MSRKAAETHAKDEQSASPPRSIPIRKALGEPVIRVRGLSKQYPIAGRDELVTALHEIALDGMGGSEEQQDCPIYPIRQGEFVMIRGPSGGGKTTLLNIIGTLDTPSSGEVELCGRKIDRFSTDGELSKLRLETLGFVFQTFNLLATLSAFENVELPMVLLGKLTQKERRRRATDLLCRVGLQDRLEHLPSEMSGGEMQRTAIARALANEPRILLLDEPTGDLDTKTTIEVMDLLLDINQRGFTPNAIPHSAANPDPDADDDDGKEPQQTALASSGVSRPNSVPGVTCVMVTHNPDLECYADRVLYVKDGRFEKQAINPIQRKLNLQAYLRYLNIQQN